MSKRVKVIPRGEEEPWKWLSFGMRMTEPINGNTVYSNEHPLTMAGISDRGKMSMVECSKMAFILEPMPFHHTYGFDIRLARFTVQANQWGMHYDTSIPYTAGRMNVEKYLQRPDVYWTHIESGTKAGTTVDNSYMYPVVYDVSSPDGQGILFKGKAVWTSAMWHLETTPWHDYGLIAWTWYCLCRQVWVTPEYFSESMATCNQRSGGVAF